MMSHPERSAAESKDPVAISSGRITGFLDFARNDGANRTLHRGAIAHRHDGIGRARRFPSPNPTRNAPMHCRPTNFLKPDKGLSVGEFRPGFPRCGNGPDDFSPETSKPAPAREIAARRKRAMALVRPLFLSTARRTVPSGTNQADAFLREPACRRDRARAARSNARAFRKAAPDRAARFQTS